MKFGHWPISQFRHVTYPNMFPFLAFNIQWILFTHDERLDLHIHGTSLPTDYNFSTVEGTGDFKLYLESNKCKCEKM